MRIAPLSTLFVAVLGACTGLKEAAPEDAGTTAPGDDASATPPSPDDAGSADAPGDSAAPVFGTYDEAQAALEKKRFPGPTTAQGSTGLCASSTFVWRETDGTLHGWASQPQQRIDYTFKAARAMTAVSDAFIAVDVPPQYNDIAVYQTNAASTLADSIPYAFNFLASTDGVIRLDQKINNVALGGTKVRRWYASTKVTDDVSQVLPTAQPPSSFAHDKVVIPGSTTIPYPVYIVDVTAKTTASVTFDGSIGMRQSHPATFGLLVSYARSGPTSALRLYKDDKDDAASRSELGDELANRPPLFADSPPNEHAFLTHVASYGNVVIFDSAFGIFAFDIVKATLVPLQLGAGKKSFLVDTMCVLEGPGLLVYRNVPDTVGQIWVLPLAGLLP